MNTILVTGATGFIGSRLVRKLADTPDRITVLVRKTSDLSALSDLLDKIQLVYGDITDSESVEKAMKGMDYVYHTAGLTYMGDKRTEQLFMINVEGTRNILRSALSAGVKRVLHVSSISAVGIAKDKKPLDENAEWNFDSISLEYARTKHLAELEVAESVRKGLDCVIVNPAFVFGAGDLNFNAGRLIKDVYNRRLPFYPLGGVCVVDVDIVAETIMAAMKKGKTGERYIIGGENVSYRQLVGTIAKVTGAPRVILPLPFWAGKLLKSLIDHYKIRNRISKLFNLSMFRVASEFLYFDSSKAIRELGMMQEPHDRSIRSAFEWYRERNMLR
ncbi:MAG: SDR family oxidoreductase [Chlorobiaceae bacterium]|nr:SDR family oxidoreductase [Chlorobiaceae bacterium]NTV60426.1 SDR family oxidoreductase [Chlorobiaceae bacterium]